MHKGSQTGTQIGSGKHWFAGGLVAAGLGAAMMAGAGVATADTAGSESSGSSAGAASSADAGSSVSVSRDTQSTRAPRERRNSRADRPVKVRKATAAPDEKAVRVAEKTAAAADLVESVEIDTSALRAASAGAVDDDRVPAPVAAVAAPVVAAATRKELPAEQVEAREYRHAAAAQAEATAEMAAAAAPTTVRVTVGSMLVDWLYSIGVKNPKFGPDFLAIPVPRFVATWWLGVRARIYRDVEVPAPEEPTTTPEQPAPDRKLLWETNFSSMEEASRYWGFQTGRWGWPAGENQYYTDGDNAYVDAAGNLVIEARRENTPDRFGAPHNYTSARVVTFGKQSIGVGTRVVARIQMPVTQGVLPAFWTVGLEPGHEFDWPRQGEIDIAEVPGFGTPQARRVWTGNIHGPADRDNTIDVKLPGFSHDLGVDLSQGFHDYGIDWYSDRIVWHVDGVEVGRVTKAEYEALGGDWTPFSGAWDHYLILNVAVGNPWTGDPAADAPFHAQMKVDWVRAYEL